MPRGVYTRTHEVSAETRAKMGAAIKGYHHSDEARAKISAAMKGNTHGYSVPLGSTFADCGYVKIKTAQPDVWEFEHRVIAAYALGRALEAGEVVHHIDGNRANNDAGNLEIFESISAHRRVHKGFHLSPETRAKMSISHKRRFTSNRKTEEPDA